MSPDRAILRLQVHASGSSDINFEVALDDPRRVGSFADALADEARRRHLDGVVCGHIHHAEIRDLGGVLYCNDGDWVESCTALVEHFDGRLAIVRWAERGPLDVLATPATVMPLVGADL